MSLLLDAATEAAVGGATASACSKRSIQAVLSGSGSVDAVVEVQGSNDGVNYETLATISLSGTDSDHDACVLDSPWEWIQAELTSINGTDAVCTVSMKSCP